MKTNALGFIGGGRITKIFLNAFTNAEVELQSVVVYDSNPEVLASLKEQFPFIETGELLHAASQQTVFIALHPPVIMETLDKIAEVISEETELISLAPKITIEKIASKVSSKYIARIIPNATSYINEGYNPIAFAPDMEKEDRKEIKKLLKPLGKTIETDEAKLEGYAIVSAMLPTYFWFQIEEIQKVAQQCGLSEEEADETVKATLKRAIKLYFDSGLTPSEAMDLIPVKPIGEHETEIKEIYQTKLMGLFEKIKA
ncbi:MAG: NAD(P)-binding domain-containing protein [Bacteroidales bacterium]|nr:NAD(P)-binding domain-containing protein [Bacteroidales bacterium]